MGATGQTENAAGAGGPRPAGIQVPVVHQACPDARSVTAGHGAHGDPVERYVASLLLRVRRRSVAQPIRRQDDLPWSGHEDMGQ